MGIYVVDLANPLEPRRLAGADFYDQPAWSPDGRLIAVRVPAQGAIGLLPAAGGVADLIEVGSAPFRPDWSPDGKRIAFQVDVGTGRIGYIDRCTDTVSAYTGSFQSVHDPAWSPDGEQLIYWGYYGPMMGSYWDVFRVPRGGGEPTNLTGTRYPIVESAPDWQPVGKAPRYEGCGKELVVNSAADRPDAEPGDGTCDTGEGVGGAHECTLRAAIGEANQARVPSRISFDIPGLPYISVRGTLPAIAGRAVLDGTSQPDRGWVYLDGSDADSDGLRLLGSQSSVRGFVLGGFPGAAVVLGGRGRHEVVGNRIGTSFDGMGASPNGTGIRVSEGAASTIGGAGLSPAGCAGDCNIIAGSTDAGVYLEGGSGHRVIGNLVGLALDGSTPLPNKVGIEVRTREVQVGDDTRAPGTSPGNVIGGNWGAQVEISAQGSVARVEGNLIGLDIAGQRAVTDVGTVRGVKADRRGHGILVTRQSLLDDRSAATTPDDVIIGGQTPASRNVIRGDHAGITISTKGSRGARISVWSNFIGTDITGRDGLGGRYGIVSDETEISPVIGPPDATEPGGPMSNLISGNDVNILTGPAEVVGNLIGTDVSGRDPIGGERPQTGVIVRLGTRLSANLISGNAGNGVQSREATITDNLIGTDVTGRAALPNGENGIDVQAGAEVLITDNVISGNAAWGVRTEPGPPPEGDAPVPGPVLEGNLIGTDETGLLAIPNGAGGVDAGGVVRIGAAVKPGRPCQPGSDCTLPGGSDATTTRCDAPCNVVSGNGGPGIRLAGDGFQDLSMSITGGYVGHAADGSSLPNPGVPILIEAAPSGALVAGNRILSTAGPGVLAFADAPAMLVYGNRSDIRTAGLHFDRSRLPGVGDGPSPEASATAIAAPEAPAAVSTSGARLTVEGQAYYDPDDRVIIAIYTAPSCIGPERLVAIVAPDASTSRYEAEVERAEGAGAVLVQAVPTRGVRGSSELVACSDIVDGS